MTAPVLDTEDKAFVHSCPFCPSFEVREPPPVVHSEWGDDGSMRVKVTRYGWELTMVAHWYDVHPSQYAMLYPDQPLLSEALLVTAGRAEQALNDQLQRMLKTLIAR